MREERQDRLVDLAREDLMRGRTNSARDRLKSVLRELPYCRPALELLGEIYFQHGDYRNAVVYWSRADRWDDDMRTAADHVFQAARRAFLREKPKAIRYYLTAFAGSSPPDDLRSRLAALETAYYKLARKQSKLVGLECAPLAGGCLLVVLGIVTTIIGAGWAWFAWVAGVAVTATLVVLAISALSYLRASKGYRDAVAGLRRPTE